MNINMLMQQAQKMQKELEKAQKELESKTFDITSAGGGIKIKIAGTKEILSIDINPEIILSIQVDDELIDKDEKEMLQDMLVVAVNEAIAKVISEEQKIMPKQAQGLKIPGMF